MLFPIQQLIEGREKPLSVTRDTRISAALALMVANDYSQLPVVDRQGKLVGIVSEASIVSTYFHAGGSVPVLDLSVDHCQKPPVTAAPESDIFEALDKLRTTYAIVIVKDEEPVGILTDYDTTHFFRDLSEGLILVEDIEVTLRQYIEVSFPAEKSMLAALVHAFGTDKRDPSRPAHEYEGLSFGQHIQLITTQENWPRFESVFGSRDLFTLLMANVRDARNQLAHFRGRLEPIQHHALIQARDWLAARPKLGAPESVVRQPLVAVPRVPVEKDEGYQPLEEWLKEQMGSDKNIRVALDDVEVLLGEALPPAAREHRSWWANDPASNRQCLSWMRAGWQVSDVDLAKGEVTFHQTHSVLMQLFFGDLLTRLKQARPGVTRATKTFPENWWSFAAGRSGFSFSWSFPREPVLRVELYIDTGDKTANKAAFDALLAQKEAIEGEIGPMTWERLDSRRASRISSARRARITDPAEKLESTKQWAVEIMLKFVDTFQFRIKEL